MESIFSREMIYQKIQLLKEWVLLHVMDWNNLFQVAIQIALLLAARLVGTILGRWARRFLRKKLQNSVVRHQHVFNLLRRLLSLLPLILSIFILWICVLIVNRIGYSVFLMSLVLNLSVAWVVIQLATSVILDRFWSRLIAAATWVITALNIIGILDETMTMMESIGFNLGEVRLSLLSILKALVILLALVRGVNWVSAFLEKKLADYPEISPSTRLMITKSINMTMLFLVALIALNSVGINLTALAVFSGAIGVGVGFGLQKVVGNFVSGLILLSDKSIKPGDVVQLADVYGWVKQMGGRCVSVITRDEKEYLIPNEDLITQQVINWSYSSRRIRVRVPVGISYSADPHRAIALIVQAIAGIDRILKDPPPACLLMGFGDSSVDLELRFWIEDPQNGVANVTSDVLLRIWDTLKAHDIEIPFPQRDVHIKTPPKLGNEDGAIDDAGAPEFEGPQIKG
jgi:small-conductance mechanosensitive channel